MAVTARKTWVAFVSAVLGVAVAGRACGSDGGERPFTGGAGAQEGGGESGSGGTGAGVGGKPSGGGSGGQGGGGSGGSSGAEAGPCPTKGLPAGVPDGWEEYTGYSCGCRVYVPGPTGTPPAPVTWEPCPQPGPANVSCQRMNTFWTTKIAVTIFPKLWFDKSSGKAFVQFSRTYVGDDKSVRYHLVADVDGPVKQAFLQLNPANQGCELQDDSLLQGKYALSVLGDSWDGPIADLEGVLAGDVGVAPPAIVAKQKADPNLHTSWHASGEWLIAEQAVVKARTWVSDVWHSVYDAAQDPEAMPSHNIRPWGPAIFFEVGVGGYRGVMSWTLADGLRPLVRYYGDYTQGAGNFNTDGVDMVWTHGEGKPPNQSLLEYPKLSVMTAPFSTDPDEVKLKAKRLRSDLWHLVPYPYGIGCGYAARQVHTASTTGGAGSNDLLVVRLSDGVSWIVSAPPIEMKMGFSFVLGVTCDEVFATAVFPDEPNTIVRIRLDSLGPGIPPD